ncbi:MAG: xanthine dehydrogenase family protein molybdopterin-binding subunit [Proteobacteria bacterium]|nr:xanthine dehydrogenase family protein molybdopterin-binding subunit [Pseudomonadota bacterium]
MPENTGIGASVKRREDRRLLTGAGQFTDDIQQAGQLYGVVVRSPYPHAEIGAIDTASAKAAPGVLLVLTTDDLVDEIAGPIPSFSNAPGAEVQTVDGRPVADASQYPLARDKVRYLGEPVAFVVAESLDQAHDAAALVGVDYAPLPAVVTFDQALAANQHPVWQERPDNISFQWAGGDSKATDQAFAEAAHITRMDLDNNRVVLAYMEPRAAIGAVEADGGRLHLQVGCQTAHGQQAVLAAIFGLTPDRIRVTVPDTGGGFGGRGGVYPEFVLVLVAARRIGRPVKWTAERGESFLSDTQARDMIIKGQLALDKDGRFLAMKADIDWRHGAYLASRNAWVISHFLPPTMGGVYRLAAAHTSIRGLFSNTTPQAAYRGIGRLETNYLIESLIDQAARELGCDPIALRRRNMVSPAEMPWTSPGGNLYSSGAFEANMDRALIVADHAGFPARRTTSAATGRLRGFGIGNYVENDGGAPSEFAEIVARQDGGVVLYVGTQDFGMGHDTMYGQILSEQLGIGFDDIQVVFGDTDTVKRGAGSHGSRSARIGGGAVVFGAKALVKRGAELAAAKLEAALADIEYSAGSFTISGTDRAVTIGDLAGYAADQGETFAGEADFTVALEAHSNGCHVAEVSIDPETGAIRLEAYGVVADVGRAINPLIVHGQIHGGAVQGIGQAWLEHVVYDRQSGQTLSGSLMDYTLPRADDLPFIAVELNEIIESDNPVGVKGAGEGATSGAPAAIMNAIRDAISQHWSQSATRPEATQTAAGHLDMPATPERVWRALNHTQ